MKVSSSESLLEGFDPNVAPDNKPADYSASIDPQKILKDPRFLKDLYDHYESQGRYFATDEAVIDAFYEDSTWRDLNTIGAVGGAVEAYGQGAEARGRAKRIESVWRQLPFFWQNGGRGFATAAPDIAKAVILDPVNLLGGVSAAAKGAQAARAAYVAGKSAPVARGAASGAGAAAVTEGAIGAGVEGLIVNPATQARDIQLGLRNDFSVGEAAKAAAVGGIMGAGFGGAIGVPSGAFGARQGIDDIDSLMARGLTSADLQDQLATGGARGLTNLVDRTRDVDQFAQPVPQDPEAPVTPETMPEQPDTLAASRQRVDEALDVARRQYQRMLATGADPERIADAEEAVNELAVMRRAWDRMSREDTEINALESSNDPRKQAEGATRRRKFENYRARFNNLIDGLETLETADQFEQALNADGLGLTRGSDVAPPSTSDEAVPNTAQQQEEPGQAAEPAPEAAESEMAAKVRSDIERFGPNSRNAQSSEDGIRQNMGDEAADEYRRLYDAESQRLTDEFIARRNQEDAAATTAADIPYRNEGQKTEISRLFNDQYTEDMFAADFAAGKIPVGRDGKLTRKSIADIKAKSEVARDTQAFQDAMATQPEPAEEALPDAAPEVPAITPALRGRALAAGLDWRDIPPTDGAKSGRITKGAVTNAEKAKANEAPDAYAKQVSDELDDIIGTISRIEGITPELLEDMVPLLARDAKYKSDAEDIVALFEHDKNSVLNSPDVPMNMAEDVFNQTEQKKIAAFKRRYKKEYGLSDEVAEFMARADVKKLRDDPSKPGTSTPDKGPRGSQTSIDNKKVFETAGRSRTGRIQSILRRGQRISKGSDYTVSSGYTVRKGDFAREEAMLQASSGKGPDLVPYETTVPETAMSPNGKIEVPKGTTLWADAVTGRVYTSMDFAMQVRGDAKPVSKKTEDAKPDPTEQLQKMLQDAKESGDINGFIEAVKAMGRDTEVPEQVVDADNVPVTTQEPTPVVVNGRKLIVRSKIDPSDIRIIGDKQIREGGDIKAIIGQKAGEPDSDPKNWEVRYAPMDAKAKTPAAKRRLFESLPDSGSNRGEATRVNAGMQMADRSPLSTREVERKTFNITFEQADQLREIGRIIGRRDLVGTNAKGNPTVSGTDLITAHAHIHNMAWARNSGTAGKGGAKSILTADAQVDHIINIENIFNDHVPQGMKRENVDRQSAIDSLDIIFDGHSADEIAEAKRLVTNLGGDPAIGPEIRQGGPKENYFNAGAGNEVVIGSELEVAPRIQKLNHELAHWSYFNILTSDDRIEFWNIIRSKYPESGSLQEAVIKDIEANVPLDQGVRHNPDGSIDVYPTNGAHTPQEYFAQQFDLWVTRNRPASSINEEAFWSRIANYFKNIYDRYFSTSKIDPDLEPLFSKILLDTQEERAFELGVAAEPRTAAGEHIRKRLIQLTLVREDLEDAIRRGSADGVINAYEELTNLLFQMVPNAKLVAQEGPQVIFGPFQKGSGQKVIRNRQRDFSEMLYGMKNSDESFTSTGEMGMSLRGDPEEIAEILTDFYYNGYEGAFEPADGLPGKITEKNIGKTSTRALFDQIERVFQTHYNRVENSVDKLPGSKPKSSRNAEPPTKADGTVAKTDVARKANKARRTRNERTDAQATADAKTKRQNRTRRKESSRPVANPATADSPKSLSMSQLRTLYREYRGTEYGDQLAQEIVAKIKSAPVPSKKVKVPREIFKLNNAALEQELLDALYAGEKSRIDVAYFELQRRQANKKAKKKGGKIITPRFAKTRLAVKMEINDNMGVMQSDGIPPSARASVREMLSFITHRDPEIETTSRTLAYRMFNILNRTGRGTLEDGNRITTEQMSRLSHGDYVIEGDAAFGDYKSEDFKLFRKNIRRIAQSVTKGNDDSGMSELVSMIVRSGAISQDKIDVVVSSYRSLPESTRRAYDDRFQGDYSDQAREELAASDWLSESIIEYMAERITRDDIIENAINSDDIGSIANLRVLDDVIDEAVEYASYMVNGHVGSPTVKENFRRVSMYGDMFEENTSRPMAGTLDGKFLTHPSYAADYAFDTYASMPVARKEKVKEFAGGGLGFDPASDMPMFFYHGTPHGSKLTQAKNPDVPLRPSQRGYYGPGIYVTRNPHVASQIYGDNPTLDSMYGSIQAREDIDIAEKDMLIKFAYELVQARRSINHLRRHYADLSMDDEGFLQREVAAEKQTTREEIEELIEVEQALMKALEEGGVNMRDGLVLPLVVRLKHPADFRESALYTENSQFVQALAARMNEEDSIPTEVVRNLTDPMRYPKTDSLGGVSGAQLYSKIIDGLVQSGQRSHPEAQAELNSLLKDMGYDGLLTTQRNSLDTGEEVVGGYDGIKSRTYGASSTTHEAAVLFDSSQVKHIDSAEFDASLTAMYKMEGQTVSIPPGVTGALTDALATGQIASVDDIPVGEFGELLEQGGSDSTLTGAVMSMLRRRPLNEQEETTIRSRGPMAFLASQSDRMRRMGANWLADSYEAHFPDMNQRFAGKFFPIRQALSKLPDSDGVLRSYVRKSTAGVGQKQPASHARIVRALRRGDGSRQERALSDAERRIYHQIRSTLASERQDLVDLGFHVGDRGPNYLPQVWNQDKIRKKRIEAEEKFKQYFIYERMSRGLDVTDEEAAAFGRGIIITLLEEGQDGAFIPVRGTTKNPTFENADYSRVIELEKYPEMLDQLEEFLEDDLESILVKYLEGSSRRITHAREFGVNSHAVSDYLTVAQEGAAGVVRLLTTNKVFRRDIQSMMPDGQREEATLADVIKMPFHGDEETAIKFTQKLLEEHARGGAPAARQMLRSVAPLDPATGQMNQTYKRRTDAIVHALDDFRGSDRMLSANDEDFISNAMRIAMKKPLTAFGGKGVVETSRALRAFNNVTLLGFTTLTSLGDTVLPIIRSGSFNSWRKGVAEWATDPEYRDMLRNTGVAMENIIHERMLHLYGAPNGRGSHAFFNATFLTPWTDMNREIAAATAHETFKTMQRKAFKHFKEGTPYSQQNRHYKTAHRFLKSYGLGEFLPGAERGAESLGSRRLLAEDETVRMGIIRFADDAIFQPNADDVPMWAQTPIGALVFQLKSFPLMMMRLGGHVFREANRGNFQPLIYFGLLGPAFGTATLSAKDIIQMRGGEDDRSPEIKKRNALKLLGYDKKVHGDENDFLGWYIEGMMVMGGLGLLGEVLQKTAAQIDNGAYGQNRIAGTFLGPTFGLGMSGLTVIEGARDALVGGENSNAKERSAVRELAARIPVVGGVRAAKENIVDAVAGEKKGRGGNDGSYYGNANKRGYY